MRHYRRSAVHLLLLYRIRYSLFHAKCDCSPTFKRWRMNSFEVFEYALEILVLFVILRTRIKIAPSAQSISYHMITYCIHRMFDFHFNEIYLQPEHKNVYFHWNYGANILFFPPSFSSLCECWLNIVMYLRSL